MVSRPIPNLSDSTQIVDQRGHLVQSTRFANWTREITRMQIEIRRLREQVNSLQEQVNELGGGDGS